MYVSEICAVGIFVQKIALFSNKRHFVIRFTKKKTITFF